MNDNTTTQQSFLNKAREDKFLMVFDVPPILKNISSKYNRTNRTVIPDSVQFSIRSTTIPEIVVPGVEVRNLGSTLYLSSHSKNSYPPVPVDFAVDNQYNNYWMMYQWLNLLHDQKTGTYNQRQIVEDDSYSDYQTDMTIYGLDEFGEKRIKFTYKKAFPTSIKPIEYQYTGDAGVELIGGFVFLYSQLHVELIDNSFDIL